MVTAATAFIDIPLELPPPHPAQAAVVASTARFKKVRAGRRWGKSALGVGSALRRAGLGQLAMWTAPTYNMARHGWDPLRRIGAQIPNAEIRLADRELWLPSGGRVYVRSCDRPDTMRGFGLHYVVMDEAAYTKQDVWKEVIRPTLTDLEGDALQISTPDGYNWWWELEEEILKGGLPGWETFHYPSASNPFLPPAELELARLELGELAFLQEYMAEFVSGDTSPINPEWFKYFSFADGGYLIDGDYVADGDCAHFMVVDPAVSLKKTADLTAIGVFATTPAPRKLLCREMWAGRVEAPDTVKKILELAAHHDVSWVGIEDVAYQKSLIQYCRRAGLTVKALKPSGDKLDRAVPLIARLESGDVRLADDGAWVGDTERELVTFPKGLHDDRVDVLAYAARETFAAGVAYEGALGV